MTERPSDSQQAVENFLSLIPTGALLEVLPIGVYACDSNGRIIFFNKRAEEIWGTAPKLGDGVARFCGAYRLRSADGAVMAHHESRWPRFCMTARAFATERSLSSNLTAVA